MSQPIVESSQGGAVQGSAGDLQELTMHIQENFGESLFPVLQSMLFQRGWHQNSLDQFYQNLQEHATSVVAECRKKIPENELTMAIEENLLRALFMGHGQNAVQMVQALRYYPLEERFLAMISPSALAKLITGLSNQNGQNGSASNSNRQSPVSGGAPSGMNGRAGSFGSIPNSPSAGTGGNFQPYRSSNGSVPSTPQSESAPSQLNGQSTSQPASKEANYPSQPQGSPNHRVQPPIQPGQTTGNSWGIGGTTTTSTTLSPYPNNRNVPNAAANGGNTTNQQQQSNTNGAQPQAAVHQPQQQQQQQFHQQQQQYQMQQQQQQQQQFHQGYGQQQQQHPHSSNSAYGGPQFPQAGSFESDPGQQYQQYQQGYPQQGHRQQRGAPAPPAPAPLFYDGEEEPGQQHQQEGEQQLSWADEAEREEQQKQQRERDEAELKEFFELHELTHLFKPLQKYSLAQLTAMSQKTFESELKLLVCSRSARQNLLAVLHPDGNYPEHVEPAPTTTETTPTQQSPTSNGQQHFDQYGLPTQQQQQFNSYPDPRNVAQQPRPAGRGAQQNSQQQYQGTKDVAGTNAVLDQLKLSPEKAGRPKMSANVPLPASKGGLKANGSSSNVSSQVTSPNSKTTTAPVNETQSMNSRLFYDDDPAYQQQQQQATQQRQPAGRSQRGGGVEVPAPRNAGRKDFYDQPTGSSSTTPVKARHTGPTSSLVLRGVNSFPFQDVLHSVSRLATIVDTRTSPQDHDEVEFLLSNYNSELSHARYLNVKLNGVPQKLRIQSFRKANSGPQHHDAMGSQTCKYFGSRDGCHRGEQCKYAHIAPSDNQSRQQHKKEKKPNQLAGGTQSAPSSNATTPSKQARNNRNQGQPLQTDKLETQDSGDTAATPVSASPTKSVGSKTNGSTTPVQMDDIPKPRSFQEAMKKEGTPTERTTEQLPSQQPQQQQQATPPEQKQNGSSPVQTEEAAPKPQLRQMSPPQPKSAAAATTASIQEAVSASTPPPAPEVSE